MENAINKEKIVLVYIKKSTIKKNDLFEMHVTTLQTDTVQTSSEKDRMMKKCDTNRDHREK